MRPKQINIWEEKVSQVTEIIEQEYENLFGIHGDKEKFANIISGIGLDDHIAENMLNMFGVGKIRKENVRQNQLVSKEISFQAPLKKN